MHTGIRHRCDISGCFFFEGIPGVILDVGVVFHHRIDNAFPPIRPFVSLRKSQLRGGNSRVKTSDGLTTTTALASPQGKSRSRCTARRTSTNSRRYPVQGTQVGTWERIGRNSRMGEPEINSRMLFTPVSNADRYLSLRSPPTSRPYVVVTRVAPTALAGGAG